MNVMYSMEDVLTIVIILMDYYCSCPVGYELVDQELCNGEYS